MTNEWMRRSLPLLGGLALVGLLEARPAAAQVVDADCFAGSCGGSKGIPQCPQGYDEVGLVLYANSKADAEGSCETVVSCTNLGRRAVELDCRFFHGFNPIPAGGGPRSALCHAVTLVVDPGDTTECATDATPPPYFQSGGIFLGADGECPVFEGKGLVCIKGGRARDMLCQAHLVCGGGRSLERIDVVPTRKSSRDEDDRGRRD